ncbi:hypothetical protein D3C86_1734690 [compost metagenome]
MLLKFVQAFRRSVFLQVLRRAACNHLHLADFFSNHARVRKFPDTNNHIDALSDQIHRGVADADDEFDARMLQSELPDCRHYEMVCKGNR